VCIYSGRERESEYTREGGGGRVSCLRMYVYILMYMYVCVLSVLSARERESEYMRQGGVGRCKETSSTTKAGATVSTSSSITTSRSGDSDLRSLRDVTHSHV